MFIVVICELFLYDVNDDFVQFAYIDALFTLHAPL